jgi:hypothetical protein
VGHPDWQVGLGVQTQAELDAVAAGFEQVRMRCIELAIHDALKEGDKRDTRSTDQRAREQDEFAQFIGASQVLKLLKKRVRPMLERLDAQDPPGPPHRPRDYRTRSFLLADVLRWLVHLDSTDELICKLQQQPQLAGAVNFEPGHIPSQATFSRRRMAIPLEDLILHELVHVLTEMQVIDGRAWMLDLTRLPTLAVYARNTRTLRMARVTPRRPSAATPTTMAACNSATACCSLTSRPNCPSPCGSPGAALKIARGSNPYWIKPIPNIPIWGHAVSLHWGTVAMTLWLSSSTF